MGPLRVGRFFFLRAQSRATAAWPNESSGAKAPPRSLAPLRACPHSGCRVVIKTLYPERKGERRGLPVARGEEQDACSMMASKKKQKRRSGSLFRDQNRRSLCLLLPLFLSHLEPAEGRRRRRWVARKKGSAGAARRGAGDGMGAAAEQRRRRRRMGKARHFFGKGSSLSLSRVSSAAAAALERTCEQHAHTQRALS